MPEIQVEAGITSLATVPVSTGPPLRPRGRWLRRILKGLVGLIVASLIIVGPWPADNSSYVNSSYQNLALQDLTSASVAQASAGPLQVGVAEADISPPSGHPLAGFGARKDKAYHDIQSHCFARALTVHSQDVTVTILTVDLLLINSRMAHAVLERTGLPPEQIYFTASHTHSGPGGWGDHPLEKLICGPFDPAFFDHLAGTLADVVTQSRHNLRAAELAVVTVSTKGRQGSRLAQTAPVDNRLMALVFNPVFPSAPAAATKIPPLAMLVIFAAHPVTLSQDSNLLSADYPGELVAQLKRATGCPFVTFAAGAVAGASVIHHFGTPEVEEMRVLGQLLAGDLMTVLPKAHFESQVALANLWLPVKLPALRYPISAGWRFSPLCTGWISDRQSHLHALRIGSALLVGYPGDYSWALIEPLADWCDRRGFILIPTSFNGEYKGYFVTQPAFMNIRHYETRWMNFFGPWAGEYLADLTRRMVERILALPA